MRIGQIWPPDWIKEARRYRQSAVQGIRTSMCSDDIALLRLRDRPNHGSTSARCRGTPVNRKSQLSIRMGVRRESDVISPVRTAHSQRFQKVTARQIDGPINA